MNFVDEKNDLSFCADDFLQDRLEPFLKFATVFRPCNQSADVQTDDAFVFQAFRNIPVDNTLGKTFHDGRLANARLADEHGIVLRAP